MFRITACESHIQELDNCQTAAVQIVEGSDLQSVPTPLGLAHIWHEWYALTDSSAKAGTLTAPLLGLVSFSGMRFWSRPDPFDLLTGCLLTALMLTLTHVCTRTIGTHTWKSGEYFMTLCNGELSVTVRSLQKRDSCKVRQVSGKNESIM